MRVDFRAVVAASWPRTKEGMNREVPLLRPIIILLLIGPWPALFLKAAYFVSVTPQSPSLPRAYYLLPLPVPA